MRPAMTAGTTVFGAALVLGVMVAVSGAGATTGAVGPRIAMADDGDPKASADVPVQAVGATDGEVIASVPDGTLLRVLDDADTSWLQVATLDDTVVGWMAAGRVRHTAHVVGDEPACPTALYATPEESALVLAELRASEEVVLVDEHGGDDGRTWVGVHGIEGDAVGMVPLHRLSPDPGPAPDVGTPCDAILPDEGAVPHQH